MAKPKESDYASFYYNYIQKVVGENPIELIEKYSATINTFINQLPEAKANFAYSVDKWTVKDVVQHLIDAERIFAYRALRFARKDTTPLSGFDENSFANNANTSERTLVSLKEEFIAVRKSTDLLLLSFTQEQLNQTGISNDHSITVNAICYIIFGHLLHHISILGERYLA